jgi:cell division protein ZapA (FtsZ GTPase activity inhibitor)
MSWIIIVLLLLILIDIVRLHRKIDKLTHFLKPETPPTNEEIENMLLSQDDINQ